MNYVFNIWLQGQVLCTMCYTRKITAPQVKKLLIGEGYDPKIIVARSRR